MDLPQLRALLTPEGLETLDSLGTARVDPVAAVDRLRRGGVSADLAAAVVTQAQLRERATAKFGPFAARMLFTRAGLEQATRLEISARHAARFRGAGLERVADLGCGIGGDSLGFAGAGLSVLAVDADEVTAAIAAFNLAPFGDQVSVQHVTAEDAPLQDVDGVWLDPARRTSGHTETTRVGADAYTPALPWCWEVAAAHPTGIKLGPGFDRSTIPPDAEAQWISVDGSTIEMVLWTGALARPGVRRAALIIRAGHASELTAAEDAPDVEPRALGEYVHEPDGAVIRARLIGAVGRALEAGMVAPKIAYLTSDAALTSPFVRSFRVLDVLPLAPKKLAAALRARDVGPIEIKKRGVDIDPAQLRRQLGLRGATPATIIATTIDSRRVALLVERVSGATSA